MKYFQLLYCRMHNSYSKAVTWQRNLDSGCKTCAHTSTDFEAIKQIV